MDIEQIKGLVELMVANDLSRVEIQDGESRILLRRGHAPMITAGAVAPAALMPSAPAAAAPAANPGPPALAEAAAASAAAADEVFVRSPMVGTFYSASSPDAAPFVNVGSVIGPNSIVCLIEAMKVFNEIKSEVSGRITRVLVKNGEAVEFDQKLFAVSPA